MEKSLNVNSLFQSLQSELTQLDEERDVTRRAINKMSLVWIPPLIITIGVAIWSLTLDTQVPFFVLLIVFFILLIIWAGKRAKLISVFAKSFKLKVIDKIIKKIDPTFAYRPDQVKYSGNWSPKLAHLGKINLLPDFQDVWEEDIISGTIRDNKFELSEIRMDYGRGKQRKTVFRGILVTVVLNNSLPSPIYILPDSANSLRDGLWKMLNLKSKRGAVVLLNHEPFEKLFKVYAEDPGLPASLLKNHVLERLVMIHGIVTSMNGIRDSIRIAFSDNSITIAIKLNTNLFEPRLYKPINDQAYFESNVNYLVLFLGLIDDLNLSR